MITTIPITAGNATTGLKQADSRRLVNMYSEPTMGRVDYAVKKRAGYGLELTLSGLWAIRGLYETSTNRLFGIRGSSLYEIDLDNVTTLHGSIGSTFGPVSMTDNGIDLVIADGSTLYTFNMDTNTLEAITDPDAPQNTPLVDYIDGYVFGFNPDASEIGEYQYSDPSNVSTWSNLDKTYAEKSPDKLISLIANNGDLWLFGSRSYEVHGNTGAALNTWAPIGGANKDIGCAATYSVAKLGGSVFWLGASKEGHAQVFMSVGYGAQKISSFNEDSRISEIDDISDAIGFTYQYKGHSFYMLTFQSGNLTLVYDIVTNSWHDETWYNSILNIQEKSRVFCHAFFNGTNYFGDYANGNIYTISEDTYTDNGNPIICDMDFPYIDNQGQPVTFYSLILDVLTGVGLVGQGEPKLQYCHSDNGVTYSNWRDVGIGAIGEYFKRVKINKLGMARHGKRFFRIRYSQPTKFLVMNKCIGEVG